MKFEDSKYKTQLLYTKLKLDFGTVYFFKNFLISEINAEVHLGEDKVSLMIEKFTDFYGKHAKISYISNRVNSYSSNPHLWVQAIENYDIFDSGAIVYKNLTGLMNYEIESYICPKEIKSFNSLEAAIEWVMIYKAIKDN